MPSWKKLISSGSAASLSSLTLDTALPVSEGGTGATTLTSNGILTGNGTSAIQAESGLTYDGKLVFTAGGDSDYIRIKRASATGRSQLQFTDESGNELWRVGTTGAGSEDFTFWDGDTNHLVLDRSANSAIFGGDVNATGDVVAFYSSDKRLKDNIIRIENPLEKIKKIGGYEFDWNDKQKTYEGHDVGVIAQEIQEVLPEVVTERDNGYLAVKYEKIVPLLIESIKELKQEVDEIKQKCDCLNK